MTEMLEGVGVAEGDGERQATGANTGMLDVFISYASHDSAVANDVAAALEGQGLKCWIAPRDVKAGALYADAIVRAISGAKAFVLVLSESAIASSHVSKEIERASSKKRPIIALRIDAAPLSPALEYFLSESQWIEAQTGKVDAAYVKLIDAIRDLAPDAPAINLPSISGIPAAKVSAAGPALWRNRIVLTGVFAALVTMAGLLADRFGISKHVSQGKPAASLTSPAFTPPPHSIAVLPFVNMSGDKEQEYFSEGLTEELLNSLSRIDELQVAARTSSFSFQGEHPDIGTVAHKLNVGAVLEGSVRRSANTLRITAQLVNGVTGFHIWSQTYDRDMGDVLKLQTEIATAVASALKVTLLGDLAAKIELGGTRNPAALDAYLRGLKPARIASSAADDQAAIAAYTEAIRLDPDYALAFAARSRAHADYGDYFATKAASHESYDQALTDAKKAIALAPGLGEGHAALAYVFSNFLDFTRANEEYERALTLAPGNAAILYDSSSFTASMGHPDAAIAAARRAVTLDPLNFASHSNLGWVLWITRRYPEALAASERAITIEPGSAAAYDIRGGSYYMLGDFQRARTSCEVKSDYSPNQVCLAMTYDKLGRHAEAEAMRQKFSAASPYWNAEIYAQRGDTAKALERLETALRVRDPTLINLKTDPLLDPLRNDPRFQAIERELKFPP